MNPKLVRFIDNHECHIDHGHFYVFMRPDETDDFLETLGVEFTDEPGKFLISSYSPWNIIFDLLDVEEELDTDFDTLIENFPHAES